MRAKLLTTVLRKGGAAEPPKWWLAGGAIDQANVYGAWNAIGAASLADSYINRANPGTHDLTVAVAPTWDAANGWGFTGTQYLRSDFAVTKTGTFSVFVRFSGFTAFYTFLFGVWETTGRVNFYPDDGAGGGRTVARLGDNSSGLVLSTGVAWPSGVVGFALDKLYKNGISLGAMVDKRGDPFPNNYLWFGGQNNQGSPNGLMTAGNIQAICILSITPSPGQAQDLSTYMANLI